MQEVKMKTSKLKEVLEKNRISHKKIYDEAIKGYNEDAVKFFKEQAKKASAGEEFNPYFQETKPEDHTNDYDTAIEMIEFSVDDEVTLKQREFVQYVRDGWDWKNTFVAISSNYLNRG